MNLLKLDEDVDYLQINILIPDDLLINDDTHTKIYNNKKLEGNMFCPKCGNKLIYRRGKYGPFIGCTNYPKCKYI